MNSIIGTDHIWGYLTVKKDGEETCVFPITKSGTYIGYGGICDLRLDCADICQQICCIRVSQNGVHSEFFVQSLDKGNEVTINDKSINENGQELRNDDRITISNFDLKFNTSGVLPKHVNTSYQEGDILKKSATESRLSAPTKLCSEELQTRPEHIVENSITKLEMLPLPKKGKDDDFSTSSPVSERVSDINKSKIKSPTKEEIDGVCFTSNPVSVRVSDIDKSQIKSAKEEISVNYSKSSFVPERVSDIDKSKMKCSEGINNDYPRCSPVPEREIDKLKMEHPAKEGIHVVYSTSGLVTEQVTDDDEDISQMKCYEKIDDDSRFSPVPEENIDNSKKIKCSEEINDDSRFSLVPERDIDKSNMKCSEKINDNYSRPSLVSKRVSDVDKSKIQSPTKEQIDGNFSTSSPCSTPPKFIINDVDSKFEVYETESTIPSVENEYSHSSNRVRRSTGLSPFVGTPSAEYRIVNTPTPFFRRPGTATNSDTKHNGLLPNRQSTPIKRSVVKTSTDKDSLVIPPPIAEVSSQEEMASAAADTFFKSPRFKFTERRKRQQISVRKSVVENCIPEESETSVGSSDFDNSSINDEIDEDSLENSNDNDDFNVNIDDENEILGTSKFPIDESVNSTATSNVIHKSITPGSKLIHTNKKRVTFANIGDESIIISGREKSTIIKSNETSDSLRFSSSINDVEDSKLGIDLESVNDTSTKGTCSSILPEEVDLTSVEDMKYMECTIQNFQIQDETGDTCRLPDSAFTNSSMLEQNTTQDNHLSHSLSCDERPVSTVSMEENNVLNELNSDESSITIVEESKSNFQLVQEERPVTVLGVEKKAEISTISMADENRLSINLEEQAPIESDSTLLVEKNVNEDVSVRENEKDVSIKPNEKMSIVNEPTTFVEKCITDEIGSLEKNKEESSINLEEQVLVKQEPKLLIEESFTEDTCSIEKNENQSSVKLDEQTMVKDILSVSVLNDSQHTRNIADNSTAKENEFSESVIPSLKISETTSDFVLECSDIPSDLSLRDKIESVERPDSEKSKCDVSDNCISSKFFAGENESATHNANNTFLTNTISKEKLHNDTFELTNPNSELCIQSPDKDNLNQTVVLNKNNSVIASFNDATKDDSVKETNNIVPLINVINATVVEADTEVSVCATQREELSTNIEKSSVSFSNHNNSTYNVSVSTRNNSTFVMQRDSLSEQRSTSKSKLASSNRPNDLAIESENHSLLENLKENVAEESTRRKDDGPSKLSANSVEHDESAENKFDEKYIKNSSLKDVVDQSIQKIINCETSLCEVKTNVSKHESTHDSSVCSGNSESMRLFISQSDSAIEPNVSSKNDVKQTDNTFNIPDIPRTDEFEKESLDTHNDDLKGVKRLFKTPCGMKSGIALENLAGIKKLMKSPNLYAPDYSNVDGVKELIQTPAPTKSLITSCRNECGSNNTSLLAEIPTESSQVTPNTTLVSSSSDNLVEVKNNELKKSVIPDQRDETTDRRISSTSTVNAVLFENNKNIHDQEHDTSATKLSVELNNATDSSTCENEGVSINGSLNQVSNEEIIKESGNETFIKPASREGSMEIINVSSNKLKQHEKEDVSAIKTGIINNDALQSDENREDENASGKTKTENDTLHIQKRKSIRILDGLSKGRLFMNRYSCADFRLNRSLSRTPKKKVVPKIQTKETATSPFSPGAMRRLQLINDEKTSTSRNDKDSIITISNAGAAKHESTLSELRIEQGEEIQKEVTPKVEKSVKNGRRKRAANVVVKDELPSDQPVAEKVKRGAKTKSAADAASDVPAISEASPVKIARQTNARQKKKVKFANSDSSGKATSSIVQNVDTKSSEIDVEAVDVPSKSRRTIRNVVPTVTDTSNQLKRKSRVPRVQKEVVDHDLMEVEEPPSASSATRSCTRRTTKRNKVESPADENAVPNSSGDATSVITERTTRRGRNITTKTLVHTELPEEEVPDTEPPIESTTSTTRRGRNAAIRETNNVALPKTTSPVSTRRGKKVPVTVEEPQPPMGEEKVKRAGRKGAQANKVVAEPAAVESVAASSAAESPVRRTTAVRTRKTIASNELMSEEVQEETNNHPKNKTGKLAAKVNVSEAAPVETLPNPTETIRNKRLRRGAAAAAAVATVEEKVPEVATVEPTKKRKKLLPQSGTADPAASSCSGKSLIAAGTSKSTNTRTNKRTNEAKSPQKTPRVTRSRSIMKT